MHIDRGVLKVGLEVEVADWQPPVTSRDIMHALIDKQYMVGHKDLWMKTHQYHCSCDAGGCGIVRRGDIVVPPIVSATYDGTLPKKGAEFIVSPILLADNGIGYLQDIWGTIAPHARWRNDIMDIYDRPTSPSVHLHVSATLKNNYSRKDKQFSDDILHALMLFSPEMFAIADSANVRRGLTYRLPTRQATMDDDPQNGHHGFVQVRNANPGIQVYIEWRLFEAAYDNWDYLETCIYFAACLTRALLNKGTIAALMAAGYANPYDETAMDKAIKANKTEDVLAQVNKQRLNALFEIAYPQIDDDQYGSQLIAQLFDKLRTLV